MFVSDILLQKGGLVFTVTPGTSVAQLSQQLSTRASARCWCLTARLGRRHRLRA